MIDNDIKEMLMKHEIRLTKLETEVKNMNMWMKTIDKKLDSIANDLSYLKGSFKEFRNNTREIRKVNISWRTMIMHFMSAIIGGIIVLIGSGVIK